MKFLKGILGLCGVAALILAAVLMYFVKRRMDSIHAVLLKAHAASATMPTHLVLWTMLATLGAGILLGWAIGLPSRTGRGIRKDYRTELEAQGIHVDDHRRHGGRRDAVVETTEQERI